ncbi:MAG: hypothetical protein ABI282_00515 [Candidatus Baltobacteraceae bacterium]
MAFGQQVREEWKEPHLRCASRRKQLALSIEEAEAKDGAFAIGNIGRIEDENVVIAREVRYRPNVAVAEKYLQGVLH